jgi:predicted DNA binding CopG/RHH family protein
MSQTKQAKARTNTRAYSRRRENLVGVRLTPEELAAVKAVAARDGLTLPGALREGFLRYAAGTG